MPSEKEYELLRNEIMMKSNHIQNTKYILFTVTSALLAFALQAENYLPCLSHTVTYYLAFIPSL